jgi:hypothetical protein
LAIIFVIWHNSLHTGASEIYGRLGAVSRP